MALANSWRDSSVTLISNSDDAGVHPNRSELGDALLLRVHDSSGISGRATTGSGCELPMGTKANQERRVDGCAVVVWRD